MMNDQTASPAASPTGRIMARLASVASHLAGVLAIAAGMAWLILPLSTLQALAQLHTTLPGLLGASSPAVFIHLGLSGCIWALIVILFKLWSRPAPRVVHALSPRGSVMTETLIVMPIFLFMTFGMAQLAINNIAGILANVAVYESARAAWLWQPEVDVDRVGQVVSAEEANNRAQIAAALVMTPVAPGEFLTDDEADETFKKTRLAFGAAQVPVAGLLGMNDLLSLAAIPKLTRDTGDTLSLTTALDSSGFLRRSMLKFTHAYQATDIEIKDDEAGRIGVNLTFRLHQVMPVVNQIFGEPDTISGRSGYYLTYTRSYTFREQPYKPNEKLPDGTFSGEPAKDDRGFSDIDFETAGDS